MFRLNLYYWDHRLFFHKVKCKILDLMYKTYTGMVSILDNRVPGHFSPGTYCVSFITSLLITLILPRRPHSWNRCNNHHQVLHLHLSQYQAQTTFCKLFVLGQAASLLCWIFLMRSQMCDPMGQNINAIKTWFNFSMCQTGQL